jgi:Eukaryotic aspartyl protease
MAAGLRMPITNIYGQGDYTAQINVGSSEVAANVILDTGSSTLAINSNVYDPGADATMTPTKLAQDIIYETGGWTGPVVTASIAVGAGAGAVSTNANLAIAVNNEPGDFNQADGIMGLAFNHLNSAYDLSAYITEQAINPPWTYPWPFRLRDSSAALRQFADFLGRLPQQDLTPYFTALEGQGVERNIFAFYTLRSAVTQRTANPASDPLNNGYFILGGGVEQTDLYTGDFIDVQVVDDHWYNTNLTAVQVAGCPQENVKPLAEKYAKTNKSNSIIDSGTNSLNVTSEVYQAILSSLQQVKPAFTQIVQQAQKHSVPSAGLDLSQWPDITFTLTGTNGGQVALTCAPSTYWQLDSPAAGQAAFQILNSNGVQSILGLPLLNNYFTVFDRTQNPYGIVRFATIVPPPSPPQ